MRTFAVRVKPVLVAAIMAALGGTEGSAQAATWSGTTDNTWATGGTGGNWTNAAAPGAASGTTNTDTALFNSSPANKSPSIDAGRNIQNITFDTASVGAYTIGTTAGNALLLTSGGTIQMTSAVANSETINAPLVIEGASGTYSFINNATTSTKVLNFGGGITGGAAGSTVLTLDGSNTGVNTIGGIIGKGSATSLAVTKTGAGSWTLAGNNTYTGDTTVLAGTLNVSSTGFIAGNLVVGASAGGSAASFVGNNSAASSSTSKSVTVYSNGSYNAGGFAQHLTTLSIVGGAATGGQIYFDFGSTLTMTAGSLGGNIYGTLSNVVTNASASTATISATNNTGGTSYNVADGAAAVDLSMTGAINYQFAAITKSGSGVMALTNASAFTGSTTVSAGTLLLSNSLAIQNSPLANGGTGIVFDSGVSTHKFTVGGLNGSGNLALQDNATTPNAVALTLNAAGARSYSGSLSGAGSVTKTGAGTQTFTSTNSYAGATNINVGQLNVNGALTNSDVAVANGAFLGGTGSVKSIDASAGGSVTPGTGANLSGVFTSAGSVNLGNGHLAIDLNNGAPTVGTTYDQLRMTGGTATVGANGDLVLSAGNALTLGNTFYILSNGGSSAVSGVFTELNGVATTLNEGSVFALSGYGFKITYAANWGGTDAGSSFTGGNDIALRVVPVPEPTAMASIAIATGGILIPRRRTTRSI